MSEVWLRPNRRVLLMAMVPTVLLGAVGLGLLEIAESATSRTVAWLLTTVAAMLLVGLLHQVLRPRIGYRDGLVLFYLKAGGPIEVPVHVVEAFFLGQGPAELPTRLPSQAETVNLIARLSQRESSWASKEVKQALGNWQNGYATIRGTWCEPLSSDLIRQLNRRLGEASRAVKATEGAAS